MKSIIKIFTLSILFLNACSHFHSYDETNITFPTLKNAPKMICPVNAQNNQRSGTTKLLLTVSKEGTVEKTFVYKTSGYPDLDIAAENYCKDLIFNPASQNGNLIQSKVKWQIKFDLIDLAGEVRQKVKEVNELYRKINNLKKSEKALFQNKILSIHENMINKVQDGMKFNEYLYKVVQEDIRKNWHGVSENYPLTFLLYHDFYTRYNDYDSLENVQKLLEYALRRDIDYLMTLDNINSDFGVNKKELISKISSFVKQYYPTIKLNILGFIENFNLNNIS